MKSQSSIIKIFAIIFICFIDRNVQAQLVVTSSTNYVQLVDSFILSGINVSNITYTGNAVACGYFSNGNSTNLGTGSGIVLSTGFAVDIATGASYTGNSNLGNSGNPLLTMLTGGNTYDASLLEFDLIPAYDTLSFKFIYGSEDYPEFVGGNPLYQDHAGAFISGLNPSGGIYSDENLMYVPSTNLPVIVNNINSSINSQYYINNTTGTVMFDGFTKLLEVKIPVVPSTSYHLTIGIADGGDHTSDAGIFLESHSLYSYGGITGISETDNKGVFQFYPNPAVDKVIANTVERGKLTIMNQVGQLVYEIAIKDEQTQISTDNFQSGIYLVNFESEKNIVTKKLIIKN